MKTRRIYFAGALFSHKDLIGNMLLARAIDQVSENRYHCLLPQDIEQPTMRAAAIRDNDLLQVLQADGAIFNFDGSELDSGTVVEFMMAKMLDLPAVLLRTDFRRSGDQGEGSDQWNLMCSGYPRTESLLVNGMERYHQTVDRNSNDPFTKHYQTLAANCIEALDRVFTLPSELASSRETLQAVYEWAFRFPGLAPEFRTRKIVEAAIEQRLAQLR
jgi:nucleoside 2-deoxyribosyltransferase